MRAGTASYVSGYWRVSQAAGAGTPRAKAAATRYVTLYRTNFSGGLQGAVADHQPVVTFAVTPRGASLVDGDRSQMKGMLEVPVVDPQTRVSVSFRENPLRWADLIPASYRAGDYFVRVVQGIQRKDVAEHVSKTASQGAGWSHYPDQAGQRRIEEITASIFMDRVIMAVAGGATTIGLVHRRSTIRDVAGFARGLLDATRNGYVVSLETGNRTSLRLSLRGKVRAAQIIQQTQALDALRKKLSTNGPALD